MEENSGERSIPQLCLKGCGFFGSPSFDGLCSKCHRSNQAQDENAIKQSRLSNHDLNSNTANNPPDLSDCITDDCSEACTPKESTECLQKTPSNKSDLNISDLLSTSERNDNDKSDDPASPATSSSTKKTTRCGVCRKRLGLTGFNCRCGGLFCSTHRYSDSHECTFDYKDAGQAEIRRSNPQIVCNKLDKI